MKLCSPKDTGSTINTKDTFYQLDIVSQTFKIIHGHEFTGLKLSWVKGMLLRVCSLEFKDRWWECQAVDCTQRLDKHETHTHTDINQTQVFRVCVVQGYFKRYELTYPSFEMNALT